MTDKQNFEDMQNDDAIVFSDDNGNEIEFTEIAYFDYEGKNYSALTPANPKTEEEAQELVFCEVVEDKEGFENFTMVEDEKLIDKLFEEFIKLEDECGCGCGCEDECGCDDECGCGSDDCDCH